jgi:hypothetical protein
VKPARKGQRSSVTIYLTGPEAGTAARNVADSIVAGRARSAHSPDGGGNGGGAGFLLCL